MVRCIHSGSKPWDLYLFANCWTEEEIPFPILYAAIAGACCFACLLVACYKGCEGVAEDLNRIEEDDLPACVGNINKSLFGPCICCMCRTCCRGLDRGYVPQEDSSSDDDMQEGIRLSKITGGLKKKKKKKKTKETPDIRPQGKVRSFVPEWARKYGEHANKKRRETRDGESAEIEFSDVTFTPLASKV